MTARRLAALLGFVGVALGAFGAHGLAERIAAQEGHDWWRTATLYHLVHAVAVLVVAGGDATRRPGAAGWSFAVGITIFSGSLYAMALGAPRWFGAITPIGGLALLAGWALLAFGKGAPSDR